MEDTAKEGVVSAIQSIEDAVGVGGVISSVVSGATGGNEKVGLMRERTRISVCVCASVCVCVNFSDCSKPDYLLWGSWNRVHYSCHFAREKQFPGAM